MTSPFARATRAFRDRTAPFARSERGAITSFGLFLFASMAIVGGIALDVSHLYTARTQLQVAADVVAHGALYSRLGRNRSETDAKADAIALVYAGMPAEAYGEVLTAEDITFGRFDFTDRSFHPDPDDHSAVHVATARAAATSNPVGTFLFRMIGVDSMDVGAGAIYVAYRPTCLREGFVADLVVTVKTNNVYKSGFCIHSNLYASLQNGNTFEPRSIVSMPDTRDLVIPSDGMTANVGLPEALRSGSYALNVATRVDEIAAGVQDPLSRHYPTYLTDPTPILVDGSKALDASSFTPGRLHKVSCTNGTVSIHSATILNKVTILTPCNVKFGDFTKLYDVDVISTSTGDSAFSGAEGVQLGFNDNCATGGGARLVTKGSMKFPQSLAMYGGQMIAVQNVSFSSDANGIQGASVIAGGTIDGTTDMVMAFCGGAGMENNFEWDFFRLVR